MIFKERRRPAIRQIRCRLIVMGAAEAGEGMVDAGIAVGGDVRGTAGGGDDLGLRLGRAKLVLLGDMQHQRLADIADLIQGIFDADVNPKLSRLQWEVAARHLMTDTARKHGIGYMDPAKMNGTVDLIMRYRPGVPRINAEDVYTNEFLPKQ